MFNIEKYSLKDRQKQLLIDIIKNVSGDNEDKNDLTFSNGLAGFTTWKILLYDEKGRNIIAPLLKVKELRELGVTLNMEITKHRHPIPNSPAIYLCEPSEESINIIVEDCERQLYQWSSINFIYPCPRHLLEYMAEKLASSTRIKDVNNISIYDQCLNFIAESNDLYSLMIPQSFTILNSSLTTNEEMETHLDSLAVGISHVLLSQDVLPYVAFTKNGPAESIAQKLCTNLADSLRDGLVTNSHYKSNRRSLMLIVDRTTDLTAAIHHPFSYRSLLIDALGMRSNKVICSDKTYDIDCTQDTVYKNYGDKNFDDFGACLDTALEEFQREYRQISKGGTSSKDTFTEVLTNVPKLSEQKRILDIHMTLAHAIMEKINKESLDVFHGLEEEIICGERLNTAEFERVLSASNTNLRDKQRLYLIAVLLLSGKDSSSMDFVSGLLNQVCSSEKPFPALDFLKKLKLLSTKAPEHSPTSGWSIAHNFAKTLASQFLNRGSNEFLLTQLVEVICQAPAQLEGNLTNVGFSQSSTRSKLLSPLGAVDPATGQAIELAAIPVSEINIFIAGGASMVEYDDLKKWEKKRSGIKIMYGSSNLVSGNDILDEMNQLGGE